MWDSVVASTKEGPEKGVSTAERMSLDCLLGIHPISQHLRDSRIIHTVPAVYPFLAAHGRTAGYPYQIDKAAACVLIRLPAGKLSKNNTFACDEHGQRHFKTSELNEFLRYLRFDYSIPVVHWHTPFAKTRPKWASRICDELNPSWRYPYPPAIGSTRTPRDSGQEAEENEPTYPMLAIAMTGCEMKRHQWTTHSG